MIYMWTIPENHLDKLFLEYNMETSPDMFIFRSGQELSRNQVGKIIILNARVNQMQLTKYDCIPNDSNSPVVNEKVANLLRKLVPDEAQFFDVDIVCKDGVLSCYKLVNITHKVKGIDHEKSECIMMKEDKNAILTFKYVAYKPGCLGELKIARDDEYLSTILVSEELKQIFEKEKITGVFFAKPEEWYSSAYAQWY